jgi:hypothetical protein
MVLTDAHPIVTELLAQYERFLDATNAPEQKLVSRFMDKIQSHRYLDAAYDFGDLQHFPLNLNRGE